MLNEKLKLNQQIFSEGQSLISLRDGLREALLELAETDKNIIVLTADLAESLQLQEFSRKFPDRFFDCGVAEQNMVGIASGLAASGKIPFIGSYAVFSPGRNWEQIRTAICYNNVPVKIIGGHAGLMTGPDGATHQATEDLALMRVLPNMQVFAPGDALETKRIVKAAAYTRLPAYIRLARPVVPSLTSLETPFEVGRIYVFWEHEAPQASIISCGPMTYYALFAAQALAQENINVEVLHCPTIKPCDTKTIIDHTKVSGVLVTVEDHQIAGGLGSLVAECLVQEYPLPMEFVGVKDRFAESGQPEELFDKYELQAEDIVAAVKRTLKRK